MTPEEIAEVLLVASGVVVGFVAGWLHGVGTPEPISPAGPIIAGAMAVGLVLMAVGIEKQDVSIDIG